MHFASTKLNCGVALVARLLALVNMVLAAACLLLCAALVRPGRPLALPIIGGSGGLYRGVRFPL
jgi:hypothetical protein